MINSNSKLDRIGFGCVKLSSMRSEKEAVNLLIEAYDGGVRWFDTAPLYGQGYSEMIVGKFLRKLNPSERQSVQVISKFGLGPVQSYRLPAKLALPANYLVKKIKGDGGGEPLSSENHVPLQRPRRVDFNYIKAQRDASLKRLGVDSLYGYLGHEIVLDSLSDEARYFLESQKKAGFIAKLGFGTSTNNFLHWMTGELGDEWDIIQYEVSSHQKMRQMESLFKGRMHVVHSVFSKANIFHGQYPDLKSCFEEFSHPRFLFSTTSRKRLKLNLEL